MATWVRQGTGTAPSSSGADLTGIYLVDNNTAPADFSASNVNSVRFQYTITGSGFSDDTWDNAHDAVFGRSSINAYAFYNGTDTTGLGNEANSTDGTDNTPSLVASVADWENAELYIRTGSAYALYQASKMNDNATLTMSALTITIDYSPTYTEDTNLSVTTTITAPTETFTAASHHVLVNEKIENHDGTADANNYTFTTGPSAGNLQVLVMHSRPTNRPVVESIEGSWKRWKVAAQVKNVTNNDWLTIFYNVATGTETGVKWYSPNRGSNDYDTAVYMEIDGFTNGVVFTETATSAETTSATKVAGPSGTLQNVPAIVIAGSSSRTTGVTTTTLDSVSNSFTSEGQADTGAAAANWTYVGAASKVIESGTTSQSTTFTWSDSGQVMSALVVFRNANKYDETYQPGYMSFNGTDEWVNSTNDFSLGQTNGVRFIAAYEYDGAADVESTNTGILTNTDSISSRGIYAANDGQGDFLVRWHNGAGAEQRETATDLNPPIDLYGPQITHWDLDLDAGASDHEATFWIGAGADPGFYGYDNYQDYTESHTIVVNTAGTTSVTAATDPIGIGRGSGGSAYFKGKVYWVRITDNGSPVFTVDFRGNTEPTTSLEGETLLHGATQGDPVHTPAKNLLDVVCTITGTDNLTGGIISETDLPLSIVTTVSAPTQAQTHDEAPLSQTVTTTLTATDGIVYTETGLALSVVTTLTGTDAKVLVEAVTLTTITTTLTVVDGIVYTDAALALGIVTTLTEVDSTLLTEAAALTVTSTLTASDGLYWLEALSDTYTTTLTGTDDQLWGEALSLTATTTLSGTDAVTGAEATALSVVSTLTATDGIIYTDADLALSIVTTLTGTDNLTSGIIDETGLPLSIVTTLTVTDGIVYTDALSLPVTTTLTATDAGTLVEAASLNVVTTITVTSVGTFVELGSFLSVVTFINGYDFVPPPPGSLLNELVFPGARHRIMYSEDTDDTPRRMEEPPRVRST